MRNPLLALCLPALLLAGGCSSDSKKADPAPEKAVSYQIELFNSSTVQLQVGVASTEAKARAKDGDVLATTVVRPSDIIEPNGNRRAKELALGKRRVGEKVWLYVATGQPTATFNAVGHLGRYEVKLSGPGSGLAVAAATVE